MDEDVEDLLEEDYYAFLNVSRNATTEEINTAYRNMSRIYHPDKHTEIENKSRAELMFNRTKKAYEILSDPHRRAIFDCLGKKGLETEGWELIHRTKTATDIREEYEKLAKEREERRLQQKTNPNGNITLHINATDIFNSYESEFEEPGLFPNIEVSGMSMSQGIEAPISTTDTVLLSGNLNLSNGVGSGGFVIAGRRLINKGWLELDAGAGNGPVLGVKASRNLTSKVFCNGGTTVNFRPNGIIPGIVGTLAVQLDRHTVGYLTYNAGLQSSMATVIEHNTDRNYCNLTFSLGIPHCYLSASYTRKLIEHELKLRLSAKVGTFGFLTEYGAEKKVSKYSSVYASVLLGVPTGVTLKIKIIRSTQSYIFPIHLSEEIIPAAIFYATVTPLLVFFVVKKTIIEPLRADEKQKNISKVQETNKARMKERKLEAESAVQLMQRLYQRICGDEEKTNGLIIISAWYGHFADDFSSPTHVDEMGFLENDPNVIDVKIPVQCLVKDSKLILQAGSKSELPGFYDPCMGEDKELRIQYRLHGVQKSSTIKDKEVFTINSPVTTPT